MLKISPVLIKNVFLLNKAVALRQQTVKLNATKQVYNFLRYLITEGYILKFEILKSSEGVFFLVYVKYDALGKSSFTKINIISKQNRQVPILAKVSLLKFSNNHSFVVFSGHAFFKLPAPWVKNGLLFAKIY